MSISYRSWFYGFLTRSETDLLLRDQPEGTFLIRFSSSQPGSFALGFAASGNTAHILIKSENDGFVVHEQESNTARTFGNLHELVDFYSIFLSRAFDSELPFESWFEGDISGTETSEALSGHPIGTFLVRFSSQVGSYAVSFVGDNNQISHSLIEHEGVPNKGYRIINEKQILDFNSLKEVVNYFGDGLKHPYKSATNELFVEASKLILQWKKKRAKEMIEIMRIVDDLFDVQKEMPPSTPQHPDPAIAARVEDIVQALFQPPQP